MFFSTGDGMNAISTRSFLPQFTRIVPAAVRAFWGERGLILGRGNGYTRCVFAPFQVVFAALQLVFTRYRLVFTPSHFVFLTFQVVFAALQLVFTHY